MQPQDQDNQTQTPNTTQFTPAPAQTVQAPIYEPEQPKPKNKRKLLFLGILVAVAVLIGGSAAAYFGVYLPNTPENTLKQALKNTSEQKTSKFNGFINYQDTGDNAMATKVDMSGQVDGNNGNFQGNFDVTVSGVKLPFEVRKVDSSAYVKVGDLSTLKGLAAVAAPELGASLDEVSNKLSNQWLEIDETLLKQAKVDCALGLSTSSLTEADLQLLEDQYTKVPFANIRSDSSEQINGSDAIKYEIDVDDNKLAEYTKGLNEISVIKKIKECRGEKDPINTNDLADGDTTPITLWVDKESKLIVQVALRSTQQDAEKEQFKAEAQVTLKYESVQIDKPDGARPVLEVLSELSPIYQGLIGGALEGAAPASDDTEL